MLGTLRVLMTLTVLAASSASMAAAQHTSVEEIPLSKCTPQNALGWMYGDSIQRDGVRAAQAIKIANALDALVAELPADKKNVPVGQQMNPAQSLRFATLTTQFRLSRFNSLSESRLQRDAQVIDWAAEAIDNLQRDASELASKDDPGADGAALIGLLRKVNENEELGDIEPAKTTKCSVDMGMFLKEKRAYADVQKLAASSELNELAQLRTKYHVTGSLDPSSLPSPDREKAVWLLKAVGPLQRGLAAIEDWRNLRRFVAASNLKYTTEREAILTGGGSEEYDYNSNFRIAYEHSDSRMKGAIDAWTVIDEKIPSKATKDNEELAKIAKSGSGPGVTK